MNTGNKSNAKIFIALGAGGLAIAGGLYWFFAIHTKNQARDAAQAEILAWEKRLDAARACLFGTSPASGDSGEAIAVRELTPDPWERKTCTPLVGKLSRGVADDTGLMPVEHAWMTMDRASAKVATAFAVSKDPFGQTEADRRAGVGELPDALRALDAAHAELRKAAGMSPPVTGAKVASLPKATVFPLVYDGNAVTALESWASPSANRMRAFATVKDKGTVQLMFGPGAPPVMWPATSHHAQRAFPIGRWAAAGLADEISASPVDPDGAFTAPVTIAKPGGYIIAVAGTLEDGFVAYKQPTAELMFARSTGAKWTVDKPIRSDMEAVTYDTATGRAFLVWSERSPEHAGEAYDDPRMLRAMFPRSGTPAPVIELGAGSASLTCLTATHAWVDAQNDQFLRVDETGATPTQHANHHLVGCSDTTALLHQPGTTKYVACKGAEACRTVDLRSRPTLLATMAGDRVVAVHAHSRILAVWKESSPTAFFSLPEKITPVMVLSDGKVLDILAESDEAKSPQLVIVSVPLS